MGAVLAFKLHEVEHDEVQLQGAKRHSNKPSKKLFTRDGRPTCKAADAVPQEDFKRIQDYFFNKDETKRDTYMYQYRNYVIFTFGCSIGRRAGDLLSLRIGDVWDGRNVCHETRIIEQKTQKLSTITFNQDVRENLKKYILSIPSEHRKYDDYLFQSREWEKDENGKKIRHGAFTVRSLDNLFSKIEEDLDLDFHLSTHSMRKTFADNAIHLTLDSGINSKNALQWTLLHSREETTEHYLAVQEKAVKEVYEKTRFNW